MNEIVRTDLRLLQPQEDLLLTLQGVERQGSHWLLGTRCKDCDHRMAGTAFVCSSCLGTSLEPFELGPGGVLYSYTQVHVSSSRPVPYILGYVDLDGGVRVLAHIDADYASLACDQPVRIEQVDGDRIVCRVPDAGGPGSDPRFRG